MSHSTPARQHKEDEVPAAIEELTPRLRIFYPLEEFVKAASVELEDVLLCSGVKSGTTWLQHIVHSLRTGGSMDYDEICNVFPGVECAGLAGFPSMDSPQPPPRIYHTHLPFDNAPKTSGKRIIIVRDPRDVAVSLYYFYGDWLFELDGLGLDDFVDWILIRVHPGSPGTNLFPMRHLVSWYPHRKDEKTLWLHYEDMIADLPKCIKMISDFLEIGVGNEELLKLVEEQASLEFMKKHKSKFDMHQIKLKRNPLLGLPPTRGIDNNPGRVRNGKTRDGERFLSDAIKKKMAEAWKSLAEPVTGHSTYEEMRATINDELGRTFA